MPIYIYKYKLLYIYIYSNLGPASSSIAAIPVTDRFSEANIAAASHKGAAESKLRKLSKRKNAI